MRATTTSSTNLTSVYHPRNMRRRVGDVLRGRTITIVLTNIYAVIKTTNVGDGRLSVMAVGVAGWAWSTHAAVSAGQEQTLSGRGARVYTCTRVYDNTPCRRLPK